MAKSFKQLLGDDLKNTRTLLHEAIPITGTISSGTYGDNNIKTFSHGMFQSVYDYPYLSSSANHIFDISYGISSALSHSRNTQNSKKVNIYNQMAQVLMGYDTGSQIIKFDADGNLSPEDTDDPRRMHECFFLNFSRLLTKDEIKKNSFRMSLHTSASAGQGAPPFSRLRTLGDYASANEFRSSPAGDYGLIFTASSDSSDNGLSVGLIFYQAGVVVLTSSIFASGSQFAGDALSVIKGSGGHLGPVFGAPNLWQNTASFNGGSPGAYAHDGVATSSVAMMTTSGTIDQCADAFRHRIVDVDFNNTIELNSSIYFCRVGHNEFNYSSNPTYLTGSKLRVKNQSSDLPISYITTIGLYSPDNELMAVAKLSEPIRKDPNTELTLRVRLDY